MTQTAVEWLFQKLWDEPKDKFTWYAIRQKAIQMENQQNNKTINMENKQQTAVQWLVNEIFAGHTNAWQKDINQALEMEKDELIKFAKYVLEEMTFLDYHDYEDFEKYYNKKYKQ